MYAHTSCMSLVPVEIKDRYVAPELELQKVLCGHVSAGNTTQIPLQEQQVLLTAELSLQTPGIQWKEDRRCLWCALPWPELFCPLQAGR